VIERDLTKILFNKNIKLFFRKCQAKKGDNTHLEYKMRLTTGTSESDVVRVFFASMVGLYL